MNEQKLVKNQRFCILCRHCCGRHDAFLAVKIAAMAARAGERRWDVLRAAAHLLNDRQNLFPILTFRKSDEF